jgi:hypothetical protein
MVGWLVGWMVSDQTCSNVFSESDKVSILLKKRERCQKCFFRWSCGIIGASLVFMTETNRIAIVGKAFFTQKIILDGKKSVGEFEEKAFIENATKIPRLRSWWSYQVC